MRLCSLLKTLHIDEKVKVAYLPVMKVHELKKNAVYKKIRLSGVYTILPSLEIRDGYNNYTFLTVVLTHSGNYKTQQ